MSKRDPYFGIYISLALGVIAVISTILLSSLDIANKAAWVVPFGSASVAVAWALHLKYKTHIDMSKFEEEEEVELDELEQIGKSKFLIVSSIKVSEDTMNVFDLDSYYMKAKTASVTLAWSDRIWELMPSKLPEWKEKTRREYIDKVRPFLEKVAMNDQKRSEDVI